ncbi:MAG: ABC transporter permease [Candidatus Kapabacteria bacterium]|nr:ABC transporter permease [Ignavibacteriota bacterium]MCW5884984.1 ABC transporter permease [Candidatus Kapabacteria bacterium]
MNGNDITWLGLGFGILSLLLPIAILIKYKTNLAKPTIIAFSRMLVQLAFLGLYLKYIFELDSIYLNILWIIIMMIAAGFSVTNRSELPLRSFLLPVTGAVLTNVLINATFFAILILGPEKTSSARYLIPIMGMVIGNTLTSSIVGIRSYINVVTKNEDEYKFNLMSGADFKEAQQDFIAFALRDALNPGIASTAVIGLIWLPGMMTGQILGGSDPLTAIKYQIVIITTIFVGSVITLLVAIHLIKRMTFDDYGNLNRNLINSGKNGSDR